MYNSHWDAHSNAASYAADPSDDFPYRAPTPRYIPPSEPDHAAGTLSAFYSKSYDAIPVSAYPPHYTAPTPRYMTPESKYAYPTPDASPEARGKFKRLPEDTDPAVMHAMAYKILKEYKERRDHDARVAGQTQVTANAQGGSASVSSSSSASKGGESSR